MPGSTFDERTKLTTHQQRSANQKSFDNVTATLFEQVGRRIRSHSEKVSDIDYRADCGLAAKRVLSARDYELWRASYLEFSVPEEKIPEEIRLHIKRRCGQEFVRRGLHNPHAYFKEPTCTTKQKASITSLPE